MKNSKFITSILFILVLACSSLKGQCYEVGIPEPPMFEIIELLIVPPIYIGQITFEFCNEEEEIPNDPSGNTEIMICYSADLFPSNPPMPTMGTDIFVWSQVGNCWVGTVPDGATTPIGCIEYLIEFENIIPELSTNCVTIDVEPSMIVSDNACHEEIDDSFDDCFPVLVLPIELMHFNVVNQENRVFLEWTTASEINNDYFEVERSSDGNNFEVLGVVGGMGNSFSPVDYSIVDTQPKSGTNYYRLKQVDFDGSFEYSEVKVINLEREVFVSVFPNPTSDFITIQSTLECYAWQMIDLNGRLIRKGDSTLETLDLSNVEDGMYFIQILDSESQINYQKKLIVKK